MRARLISRDGKSATVLVTPSWIARLFGARPYLLRCERTSSRWITEATQREVPRLVLDALDREEIEEMPTAKVSALRAIEAWLREGGAL